MHKDIKIDDDGYKDELNIDNSKQLPANFKEDESTFDKEILLVEYQATQDSAQFHDGLVWTVTNILWAADLVIFSFILTQLDKSNNKLLLTLLSSLGIALVIYSHIASSLLANIKLQKYKRCQDIEANLGMLQHRAIVYPKNRQHKVYQWLTLLFILIWIIMIFNIWR